MAKNMQTIPLGVSLLTSSRLAYGCWRVAGTWDPAEVTTESRAAGRQAILAAYEAGYTLFDNADIYCRGGAERILGNVLKETIPLGVSLLTSSRLAYGCWRVAGTWDPAEVTTESRAPAT